jgi:hypothetical protein
MKQVFIGKSKYIVAELTTQCERSFDDKSLLWTKRKIDISKKVIIFYNFLRLRLSLLNVSMSNYSRHDCSINPTPWTRLNFTIDDLRALISRRAAWYRHSSRCRARGSAVPLYSPHGTVIPNLDSSLITPWYQWLTEWLTAGERYYIPTVFARKLMLVVGIFLVSDRLTREPCLKTFLCFPLFVSHRA